MCDFAVMEASERCIGGNKEYAGTVEGSRDAFCMNHFMKDVSGKKSRLAGK